MKKLSMLLGSAFIMALSFSSCSDDDKGSSVSEEKLVGKWNFSTVKIASGGHSLGEQPHYENEDGCPNDYFQINADNTIVWGDYWIGCDLEEYSGTWALDGKNMNVTIDGESQNVKVSSVSASKLKIVQTYSEGGVSYTETTTFNKVN